MKVKFSIIITCYNRRKFIEDVLEVQSINMEYLEIAMKFCIIDDCSTDNSLKIIREYENLIKLIKNSRNLGLPASRNKGDKNQKENIF